MKIAIIEDRISRLEQYTEFDLKNSDLIKIITGNEFDSLIIRLKNKDTNSLNLYDCIATHRSALSNEIRDLIKDYCQTNKKPLIFFSGGITSSVFKDTEFPFLHINSKEFYSINLKLFLTNLEQNKIINLLILQFGAKWKLALLLNLRNTIAVAQNKLIMRENKISLEIEDKELIRRVSDMHLNSLIKTDLINEKTKGYLNENNYITITNEQIQDIGLLINSLIYNIL